MTLILRLVFLLLVFCFVVYVIKMIARLSFHLRGTIKEVNRLRERMGGGSGVSAEMVRCQTCGAFVSTRDAVTVSAGKRAQVYCSRACALSPAKS